MLTKKHKNLVAVAVANRTARIAWAILQSAKPFNANYFESIKGGASYPALDNSLHKIEGFPELSSAG